MHQWAGALPAQQPAEQKRTAQKIASFFEKHIKPHAEWEEQILYAAVGKPEMVRGDWLKPGATVIDVGINRIPKEDGKTRLVGDVAYQEALGVAGAITPVPGGVGQMTVACLLVNTLRAACAIAGLPKPAV